MRDAAVILAALAASVGGAWLAVSHDDPGRADRRRLLLLGLAVHALAGAVVWTLLAKSGTGYLFDEAQYFAEAKEVTATGAPRRSHSYLTALGLIFELTGPSILVARALSAWAASLAAVAGYELARQLLGRRPARWVGIALALWPSLIVWSLVLGRDSLLLAVLIVVALGFVWATRHSWWGAAVVAAGAVVLSTLRPWAYTLLALAILCALGVHLARSGRRALAMTVAVSLAVASAGLVSGDGFLGARYAGKQGTTYRVAEIQEEGASGQTGFSRPRPDSVGDVVLGIPSGILHLILGPFPWEPGPRSAQALMVVELPLWYLVLGLALAAAVRASRMRSTPPWIAFGLFVVLVLGAIGAIEGNAGTALRHRGMALPFLLVMAASLWPRGPAAAVTESVREA